MNSNPSLGVPQFVGQNGATTRVNLASLNPIDRPGVFNVTMRIGYGNVVKDDDGNVVGCDIQKTVDATPALSAQMTETLTASQSYCASITDTGNLREPANFSIRVTHP